MEMKDVIASLHDIKQQLNEAIKVAESTSRGCIDESITQPIDRCQAQVEKIYQRLWDNCQLSSGGDTQESDGIEPADSDWQLSKKEKFSEDDFNVKLKEAGGIDSSKGEVIPQSSDQKTGDEDFGNIDFDDFLSTKSKIASKSTKVAKEPEMQLVDDFDDDDDDDDLLLNSSTVDVDNMDVTIANDLLQLACDNSPPPENQLEIDSDENASFNQPDKSYLEVLKRNFGHSEFRHHQWEIIDSVLNQKRDSCVIMSTGYGKSLTFQFPSVFTGRSSVVISPLISLMEDQVRALQASGIKSCYLGSAQKNPYAVKEAVVTGKYRLIYATPEYLSGSTGLSLFKKLDQAVGIDLFAIDEAHCVSQWGVDFRDSYRRLGCIKENFPSIPVLSVTATATARVQKDICSILKLRNPKLVCTSFDRPNLFLSINKKQGDLLTDLKSLMKKDGIKYSFDGPTIIYCPRRVETDTVASVLRDLKVACLSYHAGLSPKARQEAHHKFLNDEIQVIVATVAFGMGIDKPDVRQVIHYGAPKDIESYYQEIGRAGRDGTLSYCKVLYAEKDYQVNMFMLNQIENQNFKKHKFEMFQKMRNYLSTQKCRRRLLLSYFERGSVEDIGGTTNCCDICRTRILSERNGNKIQRMVDDVSNVVDYGREAADLVKAIQLTGGRYGLEVPALVLTGSTSGRISRFSQASAFGSGKYRSKKFWTVFGKFLIDEGYLKQEMIEGSFGCSVNLASKAKEWLVTSKGDADHRKLMLQPSSELTVEDRNMKKPVAVTFKSNLLPAVPSIPIISVEVKQASVEEPKDVVDPKVQMLQTDLYALLLRVRRSLAEETGYTPHSIASNKVLLDMAKFRPSTMKQLTRLEDYSELKVLKFGENFLNCIVTFCKEKDLSTDEFPKITQALMEDPDGNNALKEALMTLNSSQRQSYIFFMLKKLSLEETAIQVGLKTSTIFGHMCEAIKAGLDVDIVRLGLSPDREELIRRTILSPPVNGAISSLTRIKDCLPLGVEYNHIKLVVSRLTAKFGQKTNERGDVVINTELCQAAGSQAEDLEREASRTSSMNKRLSSPSSSQASQSCTPAKLLKTSTTSSISHHQSTPCTSPPTMSNAKDDVAFSRPALNKSSSQGSGRNLPSWMQSSQNKTVFKKKIKSNSLFK